MAAIYSTPNASQVVTISPAGGQPRWLGQIGHVTGLTYDFTIPGGPTSMQCVVEVAANYRTDAFNPGRTVAIYRGGGIVWQGVMDEPAPGTGGMQLTAVGAGSLGNNFVDIYGPSGSTDDATTWDEPDNHLSQAISRGLPWVNPGLNSSPYYSQFWFGQQTDSGDQTITALMNLITSRGGLNWYINSQPGPVGNNVLSVQPLATTANRLLVCTTPAARTLGGDINTIFAKYMQTADNSTTSTPAVYDITSLTNAQSIAQHGPLETYIDLSDTASAMTASAIKAILSQIMAIYVRASFAGPFTVQPGQLLTMGGEPVDLGCEQAGTVCQLVLTDMDYGGELSPAPITFITGTYAYNDQTQTATITPYQAMDESLTSLLSSEQTILTPITAATTTTSSAS